MKTYVLSVSILALAIAMIVSVYTFNTMQSLASVQVGQEYKAQAVVNATSGTSTLKTVPGSIGSIIVENSSAAANVYLFDTSSTTIATTSATLLLSFDPAAGEGTYQYDVEFTQGLMLDVTAPFDGDIVITYR